MTNSEKSIFELPGHCDCRQTFFFFVFLDAFRLAVAVAAIAAQEKDGEC